MIIETEEQKELNEIFKDFKKTFTIDNIDYKIEILSVMTVNGNMISFILHDIVPANHKCSLLKQNGIIFNIEELKKMNKDKLKKFWESRIMSLIHDAFKVDREKIKTIYNQLKSKEQGQKI